MIHRHHSIILCLLLSVLMLYSCRGGSGGSTFTQASGRPNEVMLVMDKEYLQDSIGYAVKGMLQTYVPAFPQIEEQMDVTTVGKEDFDSFLRYIRNILIVDIDGSRFTKNSVKFGYDNWASGQILVTINSPGVDSLHSLIETKGRTILNLFVRHELYLQASVLEKSYSHKGEELVGTHFHYRLNAPEDVLSSKVGKDFLWLSNDAIRKRTDMIVYKVPYHGQALTQEYLVALRDSVLQHNIPGSVDGSYASTAPYVLMTRKVQIEGQPIRHELRGMWEMKGGGSMGGPFVSHAIVDEQRGELLVVESFVYHPNEAKRDLMQRMEAALFSFRPEQQTEFHPEMIKSTRWTAHTSD